MLKNNQITNAKNLNSKERRYSVMAPADLGFSRTIRKTTESILGYFGMEDKDVFRLVLVMDELFMNAVSHGSTGDSYVFINFIFEKGKTLLVEIEDEGTGEDNSAEQVREKMKLECEKNSLEKTSGRGLAQISMNLTNDFTIDESNHGGIKISFKKEL
jgi:anti-sigma regulatory factor (Ser/Thr protein kinase)